MKILKTYIDRAEDSIIRQAIEVMADGGVVLYPTDTVYGLGANIFNKKAVKKVFELKERNPTKPLSVLVKDPEDIEVIAKVGSYERESIERHLPGPYTLILNRKSIVSRTVTGGLNKVGVRIPDNDISRNLAEIFPITTTSANLAGLEVDQSVDDILSQLNGDVDMVIDVGKLKESNPSTIVDLTTNELIYLER